MVGRGQDGLGAAEIFRQGYDSSVGKIAFEVENVADIGSAPLVDGLVRITHDAQVRVVLREPSGDLVLGLIGVLVLIDKDILKAGVQLAAHFLIVFQRQGGQEQQIVEVECVGVAQLLFINRINAGHHLTEEIVGLGGVLVGQQQMVFGLTDRRLNGLRGKPHIVDAGRFQRRFHERAHGRADRKS